MPELEAFITLYILYTTPLTAAATATAATAATATADIDILVTGQSTARVPHSLHQCKATLSDVSEQQRVGMRHPSSRQLSPSARALSEGGCSFVHRCCN